MLDLPAPMATVDMLPAYGSAAAFRCAANAGARGARVLLALAALLLGACASLPTDYPRTESVAFTDHEATAIGRETARLAAQHPGQSGFALIRHGRQAFTARVALADLAERTLDVQYYQWEDDATGVLLARQLYRAAERGVRVRVLVDDANLHARDANVAAFDAHPNIEVRLFNPFVHRESKLLGFLTDFERVNHRMHNKLVVMDGAMAIVGGRNMGDAYFEVHPEYNFRDLDIVAVGPVVRDLAQVFDRFWNGPWSVPIGAFVAQPSPRSFLDNPAQRERLRAIAASYPHPLDQDVAALRSELFAIFARFVWAPGRVVYDDPASINDPGVRVMRDAMFRRVDRVEKELLVEAAYYIPPRPEGLLEPIRLVSRGVRVRILTNSLASNDVVPAFAGYSLSREQLVRGGVELHELRWRPGPARQRQLPAGSKAALHTKTMVFDRKDVFIGSFNLDSRSSTINTEAGLYVESPELARQVIEYLDEGAGPEFSFRVRMDDSGQLYWDASDDGKPLRFDVDPDSTPAQRFKARFWSLFPILDQL